MIRLELSQEAARQGHETFEESNDFSVDDDDDVPRSPHEYTEMHEEYLKSSLNEVRRDSKRHVKNGGNGMDRRKVDGVGEENKNKVSDKRQLSSRDEGDMVRSRRENRSRADNRRNEDGTEDGDD